jgi:type IV pilus assembly protein PilA
MAYNCGMIIANYIAVLNINFSQQYLNINGDRKIMNKIQQGFTLIELMIVVAIIGILAAVAIPSYQDYTARAQVTEAVSLTSSFKTGLAEYFADQGFFPSNLTAVGTTTSGRYVGSIIISSGASGAAPVTVTATMRSAGVNSGITDSTLELVSADSLQWTCNGGDILTKYRPSTCK